VTLATTAALLADAVDRRVGVAAFNVITLEYAEGIVAGAEAANRGVILQISENAVAFHGGQLAPIARAAAAVAEQAQVPVALHLDHVEDQRLLFTAVDTGFSSVMVDASRLPYAENVERTRAAVEWGHGHGLLVEAELGEVGGKSGAHAPDSRTDADEARAYVDDTGVDALAVAVGSSHAMVDATARLDRELIAQLRTAIDVPLVLHGSSGVADDELAAAVASGMVKINIGTALSAAYSRALRQALLSDPRLVDPRAALADARVAIAAAVSRLATVVGGPVATGRP
jgi:fructose-bisphosphate aldolase class II